MMRFAVPIVSIVVVAHVGLVQPSSVTGAPAPIAVAGEYSPEDCNLFCIQDPVCHPSYHNAWWVADPDSITSSWGSGRHVQNQTPCYFESCEDEHPSCEGGGEDLLAIGFDSLKSSIVNADPATVRAFIAEAGPKAIEVNVDRSAIQILGCKGSVIAHIPISSDRVESLIDEQ
jgi:hypothetical protein